jgi:hypothetical protein
MGKGKSHIEFAVFPTSGWHRGGGQRGGARGGQQIVVGHAGKRLRCAGRPCCGNRSIASLAVPPTGRWSASITPERGPLLAQFSRLLVRAQAGGANGLDEADAAYEPTFGAEDGVAVRLGATQLRVCPEVCVFDVMDREVGGRENLAGEGLDLLALLTMSQLRVSRATDLTQVEVADEASLTVRGDDGLPRLISPWGENLAVARVGFTYNPV